MLKKLPGNVRKCYGRLFCSNVVVVVDAAVVDDVVVSGFTLQHFVSLSEWLQK